MLILYFAVNSAFNGLHYPLYEGFEFMTVTATDADDPNTDNGDVRYSILSQNPQLQDPHMFAINPVTGAIQVNSAGLDKEVRAEINHCCAGQVINTSAANATILIRSQQ